MWVNVRAWHLPYREWRRLRRRAYAAQQDGCLEVCGIIGKDRDRHLFLVFVPNESQRAGHWEFGWPSFWKARERLRFAGGRYLGMFHSHPVSEPIMGPGDLRGAGINTMHLIYDVA
jgi:hypothetical protein